MKSYTLFLFRLGLCLGLLPGGLFGARSAAHRFGFLGPEIFPIERGVANLRVADLNGDGKMDLVVANNLRSRINLLYNRTGEPVKPPVLKAGNVNKLPPDARFRIESITAENRIASLEVADLNSDGRPDIAYFGMPKELLVLYNGKDGWSKAKRWPGVDGMSGGGGLVAADINGDNRTDLVLRGEKQLTILRQKKDGTLSRPEGIPFSGNVKAFQIVDLNGDKRNDLVLIDWATTAPFRFRLQNELGQMGPEIHFRMPALRAFWAEDLDGDGRAEIMTIAQQSGRAQVHHLELRKAEKDSGKLQQGQLVVVPVQRTQSERRGMTWGDLDADGHMDLLVALPESSLLSIRFGRQKGGLAPAVTFPCLSGVSGLAVADWDTDGQSDLFVLSRDEKQVAVTRRLDNGRVPFPKLLPIEGRPLAMTVGQLSPKSKPVLALILDREGKRFLQVRSHDGTAHTQALDEKYKANPAILKFHDADQDGLNDIVAMAAFEKIKILRHVLGEDFEEIDLAPPGGEVEQPTFSSADVDGDGKAELLVARRNYLRAVKLEKTKGKGGWSFRAKDQINGDAAESRLAGAVEINVGKDRRMLALLDTARRALTLCERDKTGVWAAVENVRLPIADFKSIDTLSLGGGSAVSFMGQNQMAWMSFDGAGWELKELDSYETPIEEGQLQDVIAGDLDGDDRKDLIFLEQEEHHIDIVAYDPPGKLIPAQRWRVFEQRTFRNTRGGAEPREGLVADFDGDKKKDLAVLVHDRVLLYRQEP